MSERTRRELLRDGAALGAAGVLARHGIAAAAADAEAYARGLPNPIGVPAPPG